VTDVYGPEKRSAVMRRVKGRGTGPELAVRKLIWSLGGRYRLNRADLPGKPDIVLAGRRLAVFVHGCFWHGHDCARGARTPKTNRDYWAAKVGRNRARDDAATRALEGAGWRVEVVWECSLRDRERLEERVKEWLASPTRPPRPSSPSWR
jgi:DNA mismatch endonuclease (patch repair protein)